MNRLDRVLSYFSPQLGVARGQMRAALDIQRTYESARKGKRATKGWTSAGSGSADRVVLEAMAPMRELARSLVENNPYASRALEVRVSNEVGAGILAAPAGKNSRMNDRVLEAWNQWVKKCSYDGVGDFYALTELVARSRSVSGEVLIRKHLVQDGTGGVPLRLQVLEGDYIDSTRYAADSVSGTETRAGVEYDMQDRPVAYWLYPRHPGDVTPLPYRKRGVMSERVPASELYHVYRRLRPGQNRGITDFAQVIERLRHLDEYDEAHIFRKKTEACLVGLVTQPGGAEGAKLGPVTTDDTGRIEELYPGMVEYLKPGESILFSDPKAINDFDVAHRSFIRAIGLGYGVPYELLSEDLSQINYSSFRAGMLQFKRIVEASQWLVLIPQFCEPVWQDFSYWLSISSGLGKSALVPVEWTPPPFENLDPAKETGADTEAIMAGLLTWPEAVRKRGGDAQRQMAVIEEWQKDVKARGLELSVVPSTTPKPVTPATSDDDTSTPASKAKPADGGE